MPSLEKDHIFSVTRLHTEAEDHGPQNPKQSKCRLQEGSQAIILK